MLKTTMLAAALLCAAPAFAQAQEEPQASIAERPPTLGLAVEAGLLSDYRFRGISRSDEDPALRASLNLFHDSGLYAGVRGTTLSGTDSWRRRDPAFRDLGDVQLDLYAGWRADLGGGFDLDAGALYYVFAGGEGATDYVEPYASLAYLIGPVQLTGGMKYAPSQRATGDEAMLYLYGQLDVTVPFRPWSFTAHAGRQDWGLRGCGLPRSPQPCPGGTAAPSNGSYWNWSLGATHQLQIEGIPDSELSLTYVDTDLPSARGQDGGIVLSIGLRF
jgi:uncharacterized protein (TIGR02001 family)